ncbi:EAL domain-containing protein [Sulfurimonas sp.]|uniref:putative bifunctional diguanylate cyclase/phosphodiesterase n=1 Tax=Sulfurimonas sp. TaxID=2022749 RepID=UPI00260B1AA5|nr:EAL domain-containing protein [Sulfurimonas sp.]
MRITLVGGILLSIVGSIGYIYSSRVLDEIRDGIYLQTARELSSNFEESIKSKKKELAVATVIMAQSPFQNRERVSLSLKKYSLFNNINFSYLPKTTLKPPKSIQDTITFYKNRPYITITSVAPAYNAKGKYTSNLVAKANFNAFSFHFDIKDYSAMAIVDKNKSRYLSNPFYFSNLFETINTMPREKMADLERYVVDEKSGLLLRAFELKNIHSTDKVKIILAKNLRDIDLSSIDKEIEKIVLIAALLFLLLMLLLYKVFITNYSKSVGDYYKELLEDLAEKDLEIQRQADVIKFIAMNDPLTGLDNKVSLVNKLDNIISDTQINEYQVGIVFLDLDRFKKINDVYGHYIGDLLLKKVADRLKECVHKNDIVARISGDEFVIVETNMTDYSNINLIEKIIFIMKKPFYIKDKDIHITFSIGRSILGQDGNDVDSLLKNAETAMYISKDMGLNNYVSYDTSMGKMSQKRLELDRNIRSALKNQELVAYYQPKINAITNEVIGLEALIRWKDAKKGIIYPGEFIPFCEESDLIIDIDEYMLIHAMRQLLMWHREGVKTGKVSVNISTKKLEKGDFVAELKHLLLSENFDPAYLEVEILESQVMNNPKRSIEILRQVKELGVSISIDDFGTGYSSLSYLKELPVDKIKIDRSFIIDLPYNKDAVSIVRTIIALARNLRLETIAEGVETQEQLDFLIDEGCVNIQGYYFSKPLSAVICKDFLLSKNAKR